MAILMKKKQALYNSQNWYFLIYIAFNVKKKRTIPVNYQLKLS